MEYTFLQGSLNIFIGILSSNKMKTIFIYNFRLYSYTIIQFPVKWAFARLTSPHRNYFTVRSCSQVYIDLCESDWRKFLYVITDSLVCDVILEVRCSADDPAHHAALARYGHRTECRIRPGFV